VRPLVIYACAAGEVGCDTVVGSLPEQLDDCQTTQDVNGTCMGNLTRAQSLFLGMNHATEIPESIRSCWMDARGSPIQLGHRTSTSAIAIPPHPTPDKLRPGLANELGRIGDHAVAASSVPKPPSTLVSYPSEDVSEPMLAGGSWKQPPMIRSIHAGGSMQHTTCNGDRNNSNSRGLGGDSALNSPSIGSQYGSMWGGHSMWSGGLVTDSNPLQDPVVDPLGARVPSSQAFSELSNNAAPGWSTLGLPAGTSLLFCTLHLM
jgi:hypothetical protein